MAIPFALPLAFPVAISVVIPVRGDERACSRLLAELAPFRGPQFELLVVVADDGGPDLDPEFCVDDRSAADKWLACSPGRAKQLACGASEAQHSCLWFLHADTLNVSDAARWLIKRCSAPMQAPGWGRFEVGFDDRRWLYRVVPWCMNWRSRLTAIATGDQGIFVDRELLENVGGWPQQALMEDVELSSRLRRVARPDLPPRGSVRLITSARRWRANGVWRTIVLMWSLRLRYALGEDPVSLHKSYYEDHSVSAPVAER